MNETNIYKLSLIKLNMIKRGPLYLYRLYPSRLNKIVTII